MSDGKVIDIKTKNAIFNPPLREKLEEGLAPYLSDEHLKHQAVNTVEQIACTALVSGARSLAEKLAGRVFDRFFAPKD